MGHKTIEGGLHAKGLRVAVIVARFNSFVTDRLLEGAIDAWRRHGGAEGDLEVIKVPGSWEMPVVAGELARAKRFDAIVCLGAVIRGATPHFDYVAGNAASGLASLAANSGIPIAFGVLTTNTVEEAVDRAGAKSGNKGFDAVLTAIEMAHVMQQIRGA